MKRLHNYWESRGRNYIVAGSNATQDAINNSVEFESLKQLQPFDSLIEIGCAYGKSLKAIRHHFSGIRLVGVDVSSSMIEKAKENLKDDNVELYCQDVCNLSFSDKEFDIGCTFALLMHVPPDEIELAIKDIMRVCKIGRFVETSGNFTDGGTYQFSHNYSELFNKLVFSCSETILSNERYKTVIYNVGLS